MSDFKAKMHQIRFSRRGSIDRSPDSLAVFKGPTSKGMDGKWGREGKRKGKGKGREGGEGMAACTHWDFLKSARMTGNNAMHYII